MTVLENMLLFDVNETSYGEGLARSSGKILGTFVKRIVAKT